VTHSALTLRIVPGKVCPGQMLPSLGEAGDSGDEPQPEGCDTQKLIEPGDICPPGGLCVVCPLRTKQRINVIA